MDGDGGRITVMFRNQGFAFSLSLEFQERKGHRGRRDVSEGDV